MNTTKLLFIFIFLIILGGTVKGYPGEDEYRNKFYQAYISGEMKQWPDWIRQMEMTYNHRKEPGLLYDIVVAHYGYVAFLIGVDKEDVAAEYIEKGEEHLEQLKDHAQYKTYYEAMKGAFLAFKIGIKRSRAVFLGPRSMEHINRSVELDSTNPLAWVEKGNAEYHMPRIFGGSYDKAAQYYEEAIHYFEKQNNDQNSWQYLNALAWLARAYDKARKKEKAAETYRKILALEPEFKWVKEELYPEFKEGN